VYFNPAETPCNGADNYTTEGQLAASTTFQIIEQLKVVPCAFRLLENSSLSFWPPVVEICMFTEHFKGKSQSFGVDGI
jgi:hypothetical protein